MATTSSPRSRTLTAGWGLPPVGDVHPPRFIARAPRRLVAVVVLAIVVVVSAYIRTQEINGTAWFNEAIAIGIATRSFGGVLHAARVGGSAPLYYLLLHFWVNGVGDGLGSARALSLVFALIAIPVAGWAGWSFGGERGALLTSILCAVNALLTNYGQSAQPYALLILLALVAVPAFLHAFVFRRRRYLWLLGAALTAMLYTQESTGLFLFGLGVALLAVLACAEPAQRGAIVRDATLCLGAVIVLFIPWIPATIDQIAHATSPWHYAPLITSFIPSDLVGGQRQDAVLLILGVLAIGPFVIVRSRRRERDAVVFWCLLAITFGSILLALVANAAAPVLISRYLGPTAAAMIVLGGLSAARTKLVGLVGVALIIIFCADPAAFISSHPSNMNQIAAQMGSRLHRGDVVAVAQPEQAPLAAYYLPAGVRWATTLGPVSDPHYMDWDGAQSRLEHAAPGATLAGVVASLRPGQQLLYIRPLTEGEKNWRSQWASLVRLRAAQWGQLLTDDVANGTLAQVSTAPDNYPGDCCVASSAVLYRKTS